MISTRPHSAHALSKNRRNVTPTFLSARLAGWKTGVTGQSRLMAPMRVHNGRSKLPMNRVAADLRRLILFRQKKVRAFLRRLLLFKGSKRESFRRILSVNCGDYVQHAQEAEPDDHEPISLAMSKVELCPRPNKP